MALLEDKTAVVTGGASGFGRAISRTFARNGADVIVADIRTDPRGGGTPTHELIRSETEQTAHHVDCDVADTEDLAVAVEAATELGGIDIMVNNAGIFERREFLDVTEAEYDQMMDVNVKGVFFGAQQAAREMLENGGGTIINMSSAAGYTGAKRFVTYSTSKGAVRLLTYSLASRFGPDGIRVNAIHPGFADTEMVARSDVGDGIRGRVTEQVLKRLIPLRRFADPQEIADVALFLASDLSSYVNGESILVDGGLIQTG